MGQIEIDLILKYNNQICVIEAKHSGDDVRKRALEQVSLPSQPVYFGTFVKKVMITAAKSLPAETTELAKKMKIEIIQITGYHQAGLGSYIDQDQAEILWSKISNIMR